MRGTYRINLKPSIMLGDRFWAEDAAVPWSILIQTCKLLARDGLNYATTLELADDRAQVVVRASGTFKHNGKHKVFLPCDCRPSTCPPVPTIEQCVRRRKGSEQTLSTLRQHMRNRFDRYISPHWRYSWQGGDWKQYADHRRSLGKWLAARVSKRRVLIDYRITRSDYAELSEIVGRKVERVSKLKKYLRERIEDRRPDGLIKSYVLVVLAESLWRDQQSRVRSSDDKPPIMRPFPFAEFQAAKMEVEHWREMERLAHEADKS